MAQAKRRAARPRKKATPTAGKPASLDVNAAINSAFEELNGNGIVAMQDVGYTISDGWADVNEVASARKPVPRAATFFHGQDKKRGMAGQGLMLVFGAYVDDARKRPAASKRVAKEICATLARWGVETIWDDSIETRIQIPPFEWRKKRKASRRR